MFEIAMCMHWFFRSQKTLRFTCLSIKLLCNFSMTAKLVIRMTTTTGYKSESNDNRLKPDITSNIHIHTYK